MQSLILKGKKLLIEVLSDNGIALLTGHSHESKSE
jgi:hypothetical protein